MVGAAAAQETPRPYRPIPAEVGAVVTAPDDLLKTAQALHAAAQAKDAQATFARVADQVTLLTSGLTLSSRREAEQKGPWPGAVAALEAIGSAFLEGDLPPGSPAELASRRQIQAHAQAFAIIAEATEQPEWGRDPLVKGAYCTYRGALWTPADASDDDGARGLLVLKATPVFAAPAADAKASDTKTLDTLKPGRIYQQGDWPGDLPEGWRAVRLPSGRVGAVREAETRDPAAAGLCFRRAANGKDWLVVSFAAALL